MQERNSDNFIYKNPRKNIEQGEDPLHTIDLMFDGKIIGRAELTYYSKPYPLYQLSDLYVELEYQGTGQAGKIMEQVENFLKEKKKAGVLVDAIDPDSPASGMYARRGWQEIPESNGLHVYNLPKDATLEDFKGYTFRQTDLMDRESWKKKSN